MHTEWSINSAERRLAHSRPTFENLLIGLLWGWPEVCQPPCETIYFFFKNQKHTTPPNSRLVLISLPAIAHPICWSLSDEWVNTQVTSPSTRQHTSSKWIKYKILDPVHIVIFDCFQQTCTWWSHFYSQCKLNRCVQRHRPSCWWWRCCWQDEAP